MLFNNKKLFKECFQFNNKLTCLISFNDLLSQIIIKPGEQRIVDKDKVNEIVELQDKYYKKNKCFNFLGLINIHCCIENNNNYLVDGQHRYYAIEELYKQNYNELVRIEIVIVKTMSELKFNYTMINKNTELPEFPESINKDIPKKIAQYFFNKYDGVWKSKGRPNRPYIHKNRFQEAIGYLVLKLPNKNIEQIKQYIINKNNEMKEWSIESYISKIRKIKKWGDYKKKSDKFQFWLGMYNQTSEEYIYQWVQEIIQTKTGFVIKKRKKNRKKNIPRTLKKKVWEKYIGDNIKSLCLCCKTNEINYIDNWSCGHVIAEANGGDLSIDNLRPICIPCNLSMNTMNMNDFIEKYYKC